MKQPQTFLWKFWCTIRAIILWWKDSMEENGKASGKSLTAFSLNITFIYVIIQATLHSPVRQIPDYLVVPLVSLIAALYSIKMAGKYSDNNLAGKMLDQNSLPNNNAQPEQPKKPANEIG
jgi:hypothetical protein